ncbi:MAG: spore photoproduct lyase family protein [Alkalispirochaeta sp.]
MIAFDHVYIERGSGELPVARDILKRLEPRRITEIDDAQRFFKRPGQDFARQKWAPRLILARKSHQFLYAGSERVASFGTDRAVHYNDMVRNCLFDCDYCFLQGMHRSANILVNVNFEEYLEAVDQHIAEHGHLYVSISYLSDLLGFERHFGLVRRWIEAARNRPELEIEVRTKSGGFAAIADLVPHRGVVLTWSLSPDVVARRSEAGTAAFMQRLLDARRAAQQGWRVRVCFDPIIITDHWKEHYGTAIDHVFRRMPVSAVEEVSFGVFRMHPDFLRRIRAFRSAESLQREVQMGPTVAAYEDRLREEVFSFMKARLATKLPSERIHAVHG